MPLATRLDALGNYPCCTWQRYPLPSATKKIPTGGTRAPLQALFPHSKIFWYQGMIVLSSQARLIPPTGSHGIHGEKSRGLIPVLYISIYIYIFLIIYTTYLRYRFLGVFPQVSGMFGHLRHFLRPPVPPLVQST